MSLKRETVDEVLQLTAEAIASALKDAKAKGKPPSASILAVALKLADRIVLAPGETPVLPPPEKAAPTLGADMGRTFIPPFGPDGRPNSEYVKRHGDPLERKSEGDA